MVVGLLVALGTGQPWKTFGFAATLLAAAVGTFLLQFWVRHYLLTPLAPPEVIVDDQARLTSSITSSRRSAYAISSNWLALWRTSTFRYYLHLDTAMSLTAYSSGLVAPLYRLSRAQADQREFFQYGKNLLRSIGEGQLPLRPHRIRLLIYPQAAYDHFATEVTHLIRSHSAARIPCIPLVEERLYATLDATEREEVASLVQSLGQTLLDKSPPLSRLDRYRLNRELKAETTKRHSFPDVLLIDAPLKGGGVWWYSDDGHVNDWDASDQAGRDQALKVFQAICRHAQQSIWANYAEHTVGDVVVSARPGRLESEAFFARTHYNEWLKWIDENAAGNHSAQELKGWLVSEEQQLDDALQRYVTEHPERAQGLRILDVGCGFGRHLIELLRDRDGWRGFGVDINMTMISEAQTIALREEVHFRCHFMSGDAASLEAFDGGTIDFAICMTNTLGNLPKSKQALLIKQVAKRLRPGGRVFLSTYADGADRIRIPSYQGVGLDVEVQGDRIVAAEGLESEAFSRTGLHALIEDNGLTLSEPIRHVARVGLIAIAELPEVRAAA